ncbi:fibronectin type III domain-containing protein [Levilactobacillus brevis]|uniref:fibronectin type III domain-containing protein n=1 Tax=Levilactobacillus brevis TaxID=1580 RepID=UPI00399B3309
MANKFDLLNQNSKLVEHTETAKSDGTTDVVTSGLTPNTTYSKWRLAYAGQDSVAAALADFKTSDVVADAPTLAVTAGDGQVSLSVTDGSNSGSAITDRIVYWSNGTNTGIVDLKTGLTGVATGLTNGTEYTFQATVKNGAGESAKSVAVKAKPAPAQPAPATTAPNLALGTATAFTMTGDGSENEIKRMYSLSKPIAKGTTITADFDISSTKAEGNCMIQLINGSWQVISSAPLTAGKQHQSYTVTADADYSEGVQLRLDKSTSTVTVSNFIISESSKKAPADSTTTNAS